AAARSGSDNLPIRPPVSSTTTTSTAPSSSGSFAGGAISTSTSTPAWAAPLRARDADDSSGTMADADPDNPTLPAIAARRPPRAHPVCANRSPILTPVIPMTSMDGSPADRRPRPNTNGFIAIVNSLSLVAGNWWLVAGGWWLVAGG